MKLILINKRINKYEVKEKSIKSFICCFQLLIVSLLKQNFLVQHMREVLLSFEGLKQN